jgi:hypothetical protein
MDAPRRALVSAALSATVGALLAGCSASPDRGPEVAVGVSQASGKQQATSAPSSAPSLAVGRSGVYTAQDSAADAKTQMRVTVVAARYVTAAQVGTVNKPKGQYVDLELTVKNVGTLEGAYHSYGQIKWEDASTAARDATTLESMGTGPDLDTTYKPGQAVTGDIILDVLHKGGTLSYWDNILSDGPSFTVKLPAA